MNETETKQLENWAKNLLKNDYDKFDIKAHTDSKINLAENKTILRDKFKVFFKELKPTKAEVKNQIELEEHEQMKRIKEDELKALKVFENEIIELKQQKEAELIDKYKIPTEYIKSVARGNNKAFIWLGNCGTGKSFTTRQILAKEGVKFVESRGVNSPLGFYTFLYEHNSKDEIIVFDDISGLIDNPNAYSILLGVLWEGIANWNSTTGKLKVPKQFNFNGRIIIIANRLKGDVLEAIDKINNSDVVKSRCLTYTIELDWEDLIAMMYNIAKLPHKSLIKEERFVIVDFIKENSGKTTKGLDLRTQVKAENLYLYDKQNWKELVKPLLPKHIILEYLEYCLKTSNSIKEAQVKFCEETGQHRATFYRLKGKVSRKSHEKSI